jgi:hypothetical protein
MTEFAHTVEDSSEEFELESLPVEADGYFLSLMLEWLVCLKDKRQIAQVVQSDFKTYALRSDKSFKTDSDLTEEEASVQQAGCEK